MKILSVVIPTYNVEKYLRRCLDSLVYDESILEDLELLIVNDGSKDHSLEIAREYEKKYPKTIVVIDKENGGHGSTINAGLKVAKGKYFRVIDSDDWVNIDEFADYVRSLKKLDSDVVLTNYNKELLFSGKIITFDYQNLEYNKEYDLLNFDYSLLEDNYFFMATSTIKTEKLRKAKLELDEKTFYVDMEFILLPFLQMETMTYLNYNIYRYFIGRADQSVNVSSLVKNRSHHEKVVRRILDFYGTIPTDEPRREYIEKIVLQLLNTHYIIYCKAKLNDKKDLKEIREFDAFLKEKNPDLYQKTSARERFIKWNRKTKFRYAQACHNLLSKLCEKLDSRDKWRRLNHEKGSSN